MGITYGGLPPGEGMTLTSTYAPFGQGEQPPSGLSACVDASWEVESSTTGYLIFLNGSVIQWSSKKQPGIQLDTTGTEVMAASACVAEVVHERGLKEEMGYPSPGPTDVWCDNAGAVHIAKDSASVNRAKHIIRRARFLQQSTEAGEVRVQFISTERQPADMLTKPLDKVRFTKFRDYTLNAKALNPRPGW